MTATEPNDPTGPLLVFVDLETSGDDESHHEILEAAGVVVDPLNCWRDVDVPPLSDDYTIVVHPPTPLWRNRMPQVVHEMHEASRLLDDVDRLGVPSGEAQIMFRSWLINTVGDTTRPLRLAGSGVGHFDRRFLRRHWPLVETLFEYPVCDVGVTRRMLRGAGVQVPSYWADQKPHRALPDVYLHVSEWFWQHRMFCALAGLEDVVSAVPVWEPFDPASV